MSALSEKNLIDELYSQDVSSIDSDIDSLIERQFSSFYQQYSDFSIITKFLSYRTKAYMKLLENFNSTSKIFPINLRYNLGLSQLINIKYTQFKNIKLYEYITKRGSTELFFRLAENLGLGGLEQLILTNISPVTIIGQKSRRKYGKQILSNTITDADLIDESDIPVYLPIYSMVKDIDVNSYEKFRIALLGLFFDRSEKLSDEIDKNTLEELILTFFVIESVRKKYTPVDQLHFDQYRSNLVLPTHLTAFKNLMYNKFPKISQLSHKEQWTQIFKPFITDYPKFTNLFRINTTDSDLNDLINQDIAQGDFITRLNLKYIDDTGVLSDYIMPLTSALVVQDSDLFNIYSNMYYLHKNPVQLLKRNHDYRTLYGNILKYLENVELKETFFVDEINLLESIIKALQKYPDYATTKIDNIESSYYYYNLLKDEFINFRPMSITLVNPNITSQYSTGIYFNSSITKYPNLKEYLQDTNLHYVDKHAATLTATKHSDILIDIKYHGVQHTVEFTTIELKEHHTLVPLKFSGITYISNKHHALEIAKETTNLHYVDKHYAKLHYVDFSNIDLIDSHDMTRIVPRTSNIDIKDDSANLTRNVPKQTNIHIMNSAVTSDLKSHHRTTLNVDIEFAHTHHATYYTNTSTQITLTDTTYISVDYDIPKSSEIEYQHSHTETSG